MYQLDLKQVMDKYFILWEKKKSKKEFSKLHVCAALISSTQLQTEENVDCLSTNPQACAQTGRPYLSKVNSKSGSLNALLFKFDVLKHL